MIVRREQLADAMDALRRLATDVRRPRPAEWTEEEADERTARRIEAIIQQLKRAQGD